MTAQSPDCYVPRLLRERLASAMPLGGPEAREVEGVVLLSDLQGFTALVERFSADGRAGLEELTWALNRYFADLVDEVVAHGGDVVSIAGDAFLCVWTAPSAEALGQMVARAAAAGLAIQAALHERDAGRGMRFATRIGIGAGSFTIATVGGDGGRWELLVSGDALRDAVAAEHDAVAGQVVLSAAARTSLGVDGGATGARRTTPAAGVITALSSAPSPDPRPEPVVDDARLRPHVPAAVVDRLRLPSAEWLAEARAVTVLFSAIPSLTDMMGDEEERLDRTHDAVRDFQAIVRRLEGTVKVDMDDKGTILLAIWGLPPVAHEDDAERALQGAWALREAIISRGLAAGIGVATGRAICGAFGSDRRRDYMVRGDVINLAARLMNVAPGEVTCDEATVLATRGRVTVEPLEAVRVKGRAAPVPVARPVARRERVELAHARDVLVGRTEERARLGAALEAVRTGGHGGLMLIEAEAGLGKSTLAQALARDALGAGVRVLAATADAIDRQTPYFAWRPLFAELFGLSAEGDADAMARIEARMQALPEHARLAPLLASVLPVRMADNALTAEMTGDVRADNTRRLLAAVLRDALGGSPALLLVEDAHWMDSSSAALLLDVARDVRPLLVVATTRTADAGGPAELARLRAAAALGVVTLGPLSDTETDAMVARQLGVAEAPPALMQYVRTRTGGHPLFADALVQAMQAAGAVRVTDGRCDVGDLAALDMPRTIEGVIVSRLDRLTPPQQLTLKVASVIGRSFRQRTVRDTHPAPDEAPRVPRHLIELATLDLTVPEAPEPDPGYLFKHVTTRDVTYELMPRAQRQPLHRAVAGWLEREHAADLAPLAAVLAWHWREAEDAPRAAHYLELAGEQALRGGAFAEAAVFFADALALGDRIGAVADDERRARWHKGLGTARYFLGDLDESRRQLERAVATLDRPVPGPGAMSLFALLRAALRQAVNRLAPAVALGRQSHHKARLDDATDCYRALGQIYFLQGEPAPRLAYLTVRGVNVGESAGPSPALARVLANMGTLTSLLGFKPWSDWYGARAAAMAEREGQYAAGAYVWHIGAIREATNGRFDAALAANATALDLIGQLGDFNLELEAWSVRAMVCAHAGWVVECELAAAQCI
ncbi:MAG: AAA family ATPase, partial [Gemmatimonadetes bacterium]|nr:AAA family ATPase [Gemmatimonadota bacterium]